MNRILVLHELIKMCEINSVHFQQEPGDVGFVGYKTDSIDHTEFQWCTFMLVVLTTATELAIMIYSKSVTEPRCRSMVRISPLLMQAESGPS
jgi:hypothetical protein